MMPEATVLLRVLSGPHLGAELPLPQGNYVLGSADGCDIILSDATVLPRHARLLVDSGFDGAPKVRVQPLDGAVRLSEASDPLEDLDLPLLTPCFLGFSAFAWNTPQAPPDEWRQVLDTPHRETQSLSPKLAEQVPNMSALPFTPPLSMAAGPLQKGPMRLWLGLFLVALLLGALTFSLVAKPLDTTEKTDFLKKKIRELALDSLSVSAAPEGIRLGGTVFSDVEYMALATMVQELQFPVYLDVEVDMDNTKAITAAFNACGLYPTVRKTAQNTLEISAYIQDGVIEADAFRAVRRDLPRLRTLLQAGKTRKVIRYAEEVRAVLLPALALAGLSFIQVGFQPGTVELSGALDESQRHKLQTALADVQKRLGVPVLFKEAEAQSATADAALGGLAKVDVVSVALSPMRFITLSNGERVFEGGIMPDGSRLEKINPQALVLLKDGRITTYPLRGSP